MVTQGGGLVHGREQAMEGGGAPGDAQIVLLSECWLNRCCFHFENSLSCTYVHVQGLYMHFSFFHFFPFF